MKTDGVQVLAAANLTGQGQVESIVDLDLAGAGSYFARITGADDTIQLYSLGLSVTATVFLSADFNTDRFVDGTDLTLWQANIGNSAGADADGDNDSDGLDFLTWQRQFMQVPGSALAAVPEPTTIVLGMLAALLLGMTRLSRTCHPNML